MKKIFNIALSITLVLVFSDCSNFLSIYPLNDIVEENFWENKSDVESVLSAAYAKLESSDCITRMALWGESRSDNIVEGSQSASEDVIRVLTKDNLMESNSFVTWSSFYDVINLANTVIEYAPKVMEKDPNYKPAQMRSNVAEARALRALAYFYLIRTFKDVPYVTRASKDDSEDFRVPATDFETILKNEIESLRETISDGYGSEWANKKFTETEANVGRFTRVGIYALLADMTLWAEDYESCIYYCDCVIKLKKEQYAEYKEKYRTTGTVNLYNGYPLIRPSKENDENLGNSYGEIFGDGCSFESIFELVFVRNQSVKNNFISSYYGSSTSRSNLGYLAANGTLYDDVKSGKGLFAKTDIRGRESMQSMRDGSGCRITKYVEPTLEYTTNLSDPTYPITRNDAESPNWIIYRFTDVLLMQAEAMVCLAQSVSDPYIVSAATNVNAVYRRANNNSSKDTVNVKSLTSIEEMEEIVLNERRRELLFEGKRWYDLVRVCRRRNSTDYVLTNVMPKYKDNREAIRVRLANLDALYAPIAKSELKINPELKQNPIYQESEDISKSK